MALPVASTFHAVKSARRVLAGRDNDATFLRDASGDVHRDAKNKVITGKPGSEESKSHSDFATTTRIASSTTSTKKKRFTSRLDRAFNSSLTDRNTLYVAAYHSCNLRCDT